jgi:SAM-dependent methyltransferase
MEAEILLREINAFCRAHTLAESTFGRLAVNDGKFVGRLKNGGKVTTSTVERVRAFMRENAGADLGAAHKSLNGKSAGATNFRFYDNRQKYLMFVNTCGEKWVVADRVAAELEQIRPRPPALRVFDAGMGDGTVLARVMRAMHHKFEKYPFYIAGKEISLEDVRLTLEKMPDRFFEHPATVLALTNLPYAEAPWLTPRDPVETARVVWKQVALKGTTTAAFERQITELQGFLAENWRTTPSKKTGNPAYQRPVALILYREDCRFLLDSVLPRRGFPQADFDLVLAIQPYRARASTAFKAKHVVAPLARALGPGGRLIGIHSHGDDPGLEIIRRVWPEEAPFHTDRQALLKDVRAQLGKDAHNFQLAPGPDAKALFRYDMHTLPGEIDQQAASIGTSTLLAAWNAAVYVAQIEDERLAAAMASSAYINATRDVLRQHGGLWFQDESYIISRKRDLA